MYVCEKHNRILLVFSAATQRHDEEYCWQYMLMYENMIKWAFLVISKKSANIASFLIHQKEIEVEKFYLY